MSEKIAREYALVRALFLRLMALVHAFFPLWIQVDGLMGRG